MTRAALSRVLNGHAAISPEMALRIERWLGVEHGARASAWLAQQTEYDLWHVGLERKKELARVKPVNLAEVA